MVIHNPILTGSFTVNNIDVSSITSSAANITALNATTASLNSFSASVLSYTASQNILNGTYTLTSSFAAQTASFTAFTSSINSFSASILAQTASLNSFSASILAQTASLNSFSASVLTFTGSASTRLGALEAATASLYTATSSFSGRVGALETYTSSLNAKTASFATTGSNTFIGSQVISGSLTTSGSITSTSTITAQTLVVQTITSSVVYSSGSNVFGNAIGNTQTFTGSVNITGSGPHTIFGNVVIGNTTSVNPSAKLEVKGDSFITPIGTTASKLHLYNNDSTNETYIYDSGSSSNSVLTFSPGGVIKALVVNSSGFIGIGTPTPCSVLHVYGPNPSLIVQNSAAASVGNTANIFFRNLLSTGCIHYAGYIQGIQQSTSANTGDLSFNTYNNGSVVEGIRITSAGSVGIGVCTPNSTLQVKGDGGSGVSSILRIRDTNSTARTTRLQLEDYAGAYADGLIDFKIPTAGSAVGARLDIGVDSAIISLVRGGNVGIGCTAPGAKLSIAGLASGLAISYGNTVPNAPLHTDFYGGWSGIGMSSSTAGIRLAGDAGGNNLLDVGYYKGNSVSHACWCSKYTINESGYSTFAGGINVAGTVTSAALTVNGGSNFNGAICSQTQRLTNTAGGYANMVHKVQGCSGTFSQVVICVSLNGAGGWGYIINGGGTGGGVFQSGGGYTNGTPNYSGNVAIGSGYTVSSPANDVIRFVGPGGVHPFTSIQMFGSLGQDFGEQHICIYYS